jgi:hypothetical protein
VGRWFLFLNVVLCVDLTNLIKSEDPVSKRIFSVRQVELHCPDCKTAGISVEECNRLKHTDDMMVKWKSSRANASVQKLMPQSELMKSEVYGMSRGRQTVLDPKFVDLFLSKSRMIDLPASSISEMMTWIDPSGGGSQSDFVLVTVARLDGGQYVLLGMSRDPNFHFLQEEKATSTHFQTLRLHPVTRDATSIIAVENNFGGSNTVTRIMANATSFKPAIAFDENTAKPGIRTTDITKEETVLYAQEQFAAGNMYILSNWASTTTKPQERAELLIELGAQLKRFRKVIRSKGKGMMTFSYSGKEGSTGKDDLAFGLQSACFWMEKRREIKEHQDFLTNRAKRMKF